MYRLARNGTREHFYPRPCAREPTETLFGCKCAQELLISSFCRADSGNVCSVLPVGSAAFIPTSKDDGLSPRFGKQAALLRRFRIPITPNMTKGQASDLLEERFAEQERRKAERGTSKPKTSMRRGA